jgi:uncharacterized protein YbjT (DUF2867 family)
MYVIMGATGNTGSLVANTLLSQGKQVRVVGRNGDHLKALVAKGAEPFIGDITQTEVAINAFGGAKFAYLMVPPNPNTKDYFEYENQVQEALAAGIETHGVKYAVTLSSVGAEKADKTGPIAGLHRLEERLNRIAGLNVLHLRAAYFMENTLGQADAILKIGSTVGPLRGDLKIPMIATRDIGARAADALLNLDFVEKQIQELHGQRDISYAEITSIIGAAIGKRDLKYSKISNDQFRGVLMGMGMSENMAGLLVEMADSLDSGYIKPLEGRTARNTTPTSFETFVAEEFLPLYHGRAAA